MLIEIGFAIEIEIGSIGEAFDNAPYPYPYPYPYPDFDFDLEDSIVLHSST